MFRNNLCTSGIQQRIAMQLTRMVSPHYSSKLYPPLLYNSYILALRIFLTVIIILKSLITLNLKILNRRFLFLMNVFLIPI